MKPAQVSSRGRPSHAYRRLVQKLGPAVMNLDYINSYPEVKSTFTYHYVTLQKLITYNYRGTQQNYRSRSVLLRIRNLITGFYPKQFTPCIMSVQGMSSTPGGYHGHSGRYHWYTRVFSTSRGHHEYIRGCSVNWKEYHEYTRGCLVHWRDTISTPGAYHDDCGRGDIMSTSTQRDVQ